MNKLKNIGITALAGTLVSLSAAQAGGVTINGSWELTYVNKDSDVVTGAKYGMNKNLSFGASGDLSDGGGVTWAYSVGGSDTMGLSSASMNINMGGIATLAYDSGTGGYGANAVDNIVPTAWEEIDYGLSTGITDVGRVSSSKGVVNLTIKAPVSGTGISFSYISRMGGSHIADGATDAASAGGGRGMDLTLDLIDYSSPHFGFRLGTAAEMEIIKDTCDDEPLLVAACGANYENHPYAGTAYSKIALGPIHFGVQATFEDMGSVAKTGVANTRSIVGGLALVVGDTLSVSYGRAWEKIRYNDARRGLGASEPFNQQTGGGTGPNEYERADYSGISAAVNMGPVALKATRNYVDGAGEGGGSQPLRHTELNLSIAF
jgi:hypothetical protein